ncbi:MAG: tetratricopeptide repeat protein [Rhodobacteraceae bacterium]|nr:tetratricopeptide repeat protein [Paracoccaceae bacterium]
MRAGISTGARVSSPEGRVTQAITEYLAAVQADPSYFEAYYNLGLAAMTGGHLQRALSAYERALSIKPTDINARFNFALALQKSGHARDASNELETLLAAEPEEIRAHLALANIYAQELAQPVRARPHYLKVLEAQPRHSQAAAIQQWLNSHP